MNRLTPDEIFEVEQTIYAKALAEWEAHPELQCFLWKPEKPQRHRWRASVFKGGDFERIRHHQKGNGWKANHKN